MKILIIGCGDMGAALARGIARGGRARLVLCDHSYEKASSLAGEIGARAAKDAAQALCSSDAAILAVRPASVEQLLSELCSSLNGKFLISIAAGIPIAYLKRRVPRSCHVAVAIPSLAAQLGRGATMFHAQSAADRSKLQAILGSTGMLIEAKEERLMDASFLHGSGIAFFLSAIEGMARAGERHGLPFKDALALSAKAAEGAGALVIEKGISPSQLEQMVATKKGITIHGLRVLRKSGVKRIFRRAGDAVIREAGRRRKKNVGS